MSDTAAVEADSIEAGFTFTYIRFDRLPTNAEKAIA